MRAIAAPVFNTQAVYESCIGGISDENLRGRLNELVTNIVLSAQEYLAKAAIKQIYTIRPNDCGNDEIAIGAVTKKELINVYSTQMVGKAKPARQIYDQLLSLAPLGRCPFCGFGHASTLDHYLPKARYPLLAVTPINLLPACKDCNTGKRTSIANTAGDQGLHPYFDHQYFINEQWLFAEVVESTPAVVRYFVVAPAHWDEISKARVQAHFINFKLASRYSLEASGQLACLKDSLLQHRDLLKVDVKQLLIIEALACFKQHRNSWQTAMYQALAVSNWYCDGGFQ